MYYFSNAMRNTQNPTTMRYFEKYDVEMNEETNVLRIKKDSPRSRFGYKLVVNYRFRSTEAMHEYFVKTWVASMEKQVAAEQEVKNTRQAARANFVNPYKVGQIFYDSWGYDQTNIDFYQITEVGRKSVKIRSIGQKITEFTGWASEKVIPVADAFISEKEMTKLITIDRNGKPHICSPRGGWFTCSERK